MSVNRFTVFALATALSIAALSTSLASATALGTNDWFRVDTANFVLFSDADQASVVRLGQDLERLNDVMGQLTSGRTLEVAVPTYIFIFKDQGDFTSYYMPTGLATGAGGTGFLVPHPHGNYAALSGGEQTTKRNVFRQYIHRLLLDRVPRLPLWFRQGIAEFYSSFEAGDSEAKIGLPIQTHLEWLRHSFDHLIPWRELIFMNQPPAGDGQIASHYVTQVWLLVHYLLVNEGNASPAASDYITRVASGEALEQAFTRAFQTHPSALREALDEYLHQPEMLFFRVNYKSQVDLSTSTRPLEPHEAQFRLGDLLAHSGDSQHEAAREHFERALKLKPDHGPSLAGLGYLEEQAKRTVQARTFYGRAAAHAKDDFLTQYLFANNLLRTLGGQRAESEEQQERLNTVIEAFQRSIDLRPSYAESHARLGYALSLQTKPSSREVAALERARQLLPGRFDIAFNLLLAYARGGQHDEADTLIRDLENLGADSNTMLRAREVRIQMHYRQANQLMSKGKMADAIAHFARVRAESASSELRQRAVDMVAKIEKPVEGERFSELYEQAWQAMTDSPATMADLLARLRRIARSGAQKETIEALSQRWQRNQAEPQTLPQ